MILVDTSVWIDHLRSSDPFLIKLLNQCNVLTHPFVIGELACGNLQNRSEILALLQNLPETLCANEAEVMYLIETRSLMGRGIGYIDAHILASVLLAEGTRLWTRDKRLLAIAAEMNVDYEPAIQT